MDGLGNIGLGYSVSSSATYPSIRYTGRLDGDSLGQMTFAETVMIAGGGSQLYPTHPRWGDYSSMSVDPADDSTFWYTQEYMQSTSFASWKTRIGSFRVEPAPPVADFYALPTINFADSTVAFTDASSGVPSSWSWTFAPDSVTYVNGTSDTSQNPEVQFTATGTFDVELIATNALGSDTITRSSYIDILFNLPITLPFTEDFESAGPILSYSSNTSVLDGIPRWSYEKTNNGRLRMQAESGFYHGGSQAAILDAEPAGTVSLNYLILTLNLSFYTTDDLLLSFYYMQHGEESQSGDRVWVRGGASDTWIEIYDLYANQAEAGTWKEVMHLDITNTLASAIPSQTVSSTFRIRFGQEDNYPASTITEADGVTFDDILVEVNNDVPTVDFVADITDPNMNAAIQFSDQSSHAPTQWQWNFPGGAPSYSTLESPIVQYPEGGYYDVTLTATNVNGSAFLSKADYITVLKDSVLFYDDFESLSGWTLSGEFEIGAPTGIGGAHGYPDPDTAFEGTQILGVDLSGLGSSLGDYENNLTTKEYQAISPVINCTGADVVNLSFMRWLNIEASILDHADIDVSDGGSLETIWSNIDIIEENAWGLQYFDISAKAANESTVKIIFNIGSTDEEWTYSGWNIDSLKVSKMMSPTLYNSSWTGAQDNNWNNSSNWSHGQIPDTNYNVTIPAFIPGANSPETFTESSNSINKLIVEPGAIIIIPSGDTLIIHEEP